MSDTESPDKGPEEPKLVHVNPPEDQDLRSAWDQYLQRCCEVGQLLRQLEEMDSATRKMEKTLEVTKEQARKADLNYKKMRLEKQEAAAKEEPKIELKSH